MPRVVVMMIGVSIMMMDVRHAMLMGEYVESLDQGGPRAESHGDGKQNASHAAGV